MSDKAMYGYLAGIVDGEGTITIGRSENTAEKKGKYRHGQVYTSVGFSVKASVKNTDLRLMKWLKKRFGGEFYKDTTNRNPNWKDAYVWFHAAESKQEFLLSILPYLIIKRDQALVALEFLRLGSDRNPEKRQGLYEKIVALNQRGKLVETNTLDSSNEEMRESVLTGDSESAPVVTQVLTEQTWPCTSCGNNHRQFEGCFVPNVS